MIKTVSVILLLSSLAFANPFASGNKSIGVTVGSGSVSYGTTGLITTTNVENYYIVGVNADFFVFENLQKKQNIQLKILIFAELFLLLKNSETDLKATLNRVQRPFY